MKFVLRILVISLLWAAPAVGQVSVSGNLRDITGTIVTSNAEVDFELQNYRGLIPRVSGTGTIAQVKKVFKPDGTGAIHCVGSGCTDTLYQNAGITPPGTFYSVCIILNGQTLRCNNYLINTTFDLNSAIPLNVTTALGPGQLITQAYNCVNLTPATTWTCTHNLNDNYPLVEVYNTAGLLLSPGGSNPFTVTATTANVITIVFNSSQAGTARIATVGQFSIATNQPTAILSNPLTPQTIVGFGLTLPSLTDGGLTSGNCVQAGAGGLLTTIGSGCPGLGSNNGFGGNNTFTGSTGLNGGGNFSGTFSGTPTQTGLWTFNAIKPSDVTEGTAYTSFGDSITFCFGVVTQSNCYVNQIATAKTWTNTNNGVSGSGITDAGQMDSILGTTVSTGSISTELCCVNDMRNNAGSGILGAAQQINWASSLEAALLWLAVPDANKVKASGGSVVYTGSWTTPPVSYGGLARQTTGAGNTASFSIYGTSVYVVSLWQASNSSTYTISIDGVTQPTIATITGAYQTIQGRAFGPLVTRFSGLTEITHSIVLTCTAADANNPCYFVFAGSGTGAATRTGPLVYVGNTLRFTSAGYAGNGGSDTVVGQFNQRIKQVANELASDGMHVAQVDVSGYYVPNGTNTQGDGVHPSDAGHLVIAQAFLHDMNGLLLPKDRAALQILQNINACTNGGATGGAWLIGGCPSTGGASRGDLGAARTQTSGAMFFGLDGSGILRTSSTWLFASVPNPTLLQFGGTSSSFPAFKFAGGPAKITIRNGDDSADSALQALSLNLSGGVVNSGVGKKHVRIASCTTGNVALNTCNTTVTWPGTAFADTNYTAVCFAEGLNAIGHLSHYGTKLAGSIVVALVTDTAVAISGTIDCIAEHD